MKAGMLTVLWCAVAMMSIAGCRNAERRPYDFERMRQQQRYGLWGGSRVFANGMTMQAPPEGTVAREAVVGPAGLSTGRNGGAFVDVVPIAVTSALLERGKSRFGIYCAACHGVAGFGGSIVAANMIEARPPSLRSTDAKRLTPGYLFDVMTNGKGRMASYSWALSLADRWAVAAYVKQLQMQPHKDPLSIEDSIRAAFLHATDSLAADTGAATAGASAKRQ